MRYVVTMIILLAFMTPMAFANGGPSFEQLYDNSHKGKRVVELIDQSNRDGEKGKICFTNVGQNKVEKKPC